MLVTYPAPGRRAKGVATRRCASGSDRDGRVPEIESHRNVIREIKAKSNSQSSEVFGNANFAILNGRNFSRKGKAKKER